MMTIHQKKRFLKKKDERKICLPLSINSAIYFFGYFNFCTMSSTNKTGKQLKKILLNKYLIVFVLFTVFVTFFDEHSLIHRWETYRKIVGMEKELKFYQDEIKSTKQKKNELQSSKENLEKFAREHYFMKKKNEDIFIIKE
jgi:cell division protein DivIC